MITLYHGTNIEAGLSIIHDKTIKHQIKRRFDESTGNPTTDGYIYLTDSIGFATYHANTHNRMSLGKNEYCIFIFRVTVDENQLSADIDEYLLQEGTIIDGINIHEYGYERSLNELATCRINTELSPENSTIEYAFIDDNLVEAIGTKVWSKFIENSLNVHENKNKFDSLILKHLTFKPLQTNKKSRPSK